MHKERDLGHKLLCVVVVACQNNIGFYNKILTFQTENMNFSDNFWVYLDFTFFL